MSGMQSVNPATGKTERQFELLDAAAIDAALEKAHQAFQQGHSLSLDERAAMMRKAAELLRQDKDKLGRLMTLEMGKTISDGASNLPDNELAFFFEDEELKTKHNYSVISDP